MSPSRALSEVCLSSFSLHHQAEITFSWAFPSDSVPSGAEALPTLLLWRADEETLFVGFIFVLGLITHGRRAESAELLSDQSLSWEGLTERWWLLLHGQALHLPPFSPQHAPRLPRLRLRSLALSE